MHTITMKVAAHGSYLSATRWLPRLLSATAATNLRPTQALLAIAMMSLVEFAGRFAQTLQAPAPMSTKRG
jgi:hypothetical protein